MKNYDWLENKKLRSVRNLNLWSENPRLDLDQDQVSITQYASELLSDSGEKDSFLKLINSIAENGYIPADPIVVWQNPETGHFYVAEGNRRVLALKLLIDPSKCPRSIKPFVSKRSINMDTDSIEKIRVAVSPNFEETEWYINQRHSSNGILRPWSRHQQQRWIAKLYEKHNKSVDKIQEITGLSISQLNEILRILEIRDMALNESITNLLDDSDIQALKSHKLPMTILERWFGNSEVKAAWGIKMLDDKVLITSDINSFNIAYAKWIHYVIRRDEPNIDLRINTRTITNELENILMKLPRVLNNEDDSKDNKSENYGNENHKLDGEESNYRDGDSKDPDGSKNANNSDIKRKLQYDDPNRRRLVLDGCTVNTSSFKIQAILNEFKALPTTRYPNCLAATLRVFLDLSVDEYYEEQNLKDEICAQKKSDFNKITLHERISFLENKITDKDALKVINNLKNTSNRYSLTILNSFVHGKNTEHLEKSYLNGFWNFLFPLLSILIDIEQKQ